MAPPFNSNRNTVRVPFDFSEDAITEIKRLDKEREIEIVPITVGDLPRREGLGVFD